MILVDTSVWIEFFNKPNSRSASVLKELIDGKQSLAINGLVEMEILQGIRSDKQLLLMQRMLKPYQYFPELPKDWLDEAVSIYRKCRSSGVTIRKSVDCIIAANALAHDMTVFHKDRDFEQIRKSFPGLSTLTA